MFNHKFKEDLDFILQKIQNKEPFALARYADGEFAVLKNHKITGCDGWSITVEDKPFAEELQISLLHKEHNYFYGISCLCCDPSTHSQLKNILIDNWDRVTFSNIFVNSNWKKSYDFFMNYEDKIFICNANSKMTKNFYKVPENVLKFYRFDKVSLKNYYCDIAKKYNNKLFCISAGPLAELIIHWMYLENPDNQYIDIGSCLDPYIHGKFTRLYHYENNEFSRRVCSL